MISEKEQFINDYKKMARENKAMIFALPTEKMVKVMAAVEAILQGLKEVGLSAEDIHLAAKMVVSLSNPKLRPTTPDHKKWVSQATEELIAEAAADSASKRNREPSSLKSILEEALRNLH